MQQDYLPITIRHDNDSDVYQTSTSSDNLAVFLMEFQDSLFLSL